MQRLRRRSHNSCELPVAAEVLETRSLLSAALAAAHGAAHHAQAAVHQAQIIAHAKQKLSITAEVSPLTPGPGFTQDFSGELSIASLKPNVGGLFSAQLKATAGVSVGVETITATISGKVQSIQRNLDGSGTLFLTPGRNNFVEKLKGSTGTHVVQSAQTDGEIMEVNLDASGNFQSLDLVEQVPKTSPLETFDLFCTV